MCVSGDFPLGPNQTPEYWGYGPSLFYFIAPCLNLTVAILLEVLSVFFSVYIVSGANPPLVTKVRSYSTNTLRSFFFFQEICEQVPNINVDGSNEW